MALPQRKRGSPYWKIKTSSFYGAAECQADEIPVLAKGLVQEEWQLQQDQLQSEEEQEKIT